MKVLITGVSGFIGPHLFEACLKRGWGVLGIDLLPFKLPPEQTISTGLQAQFEFKQKDVRSLTLSELDGTDFVFHLAFVTNIPNSVQHPLETTRDNIDMTAFILDLATKAGIKKFVFPSTASLYGNNPTPWREDMPSNPIEPYSWQKLSCEYACKMWNTRYGLPTVVLRLFQVFGERPRWDSALYAFLRAKKENRPITLTETTAQSSFRTGQRDFIYVKDVAEAFLRAAESSKAGKGETINIASGVVNTVEEVARAIGGEVVFIPRRSYEVERHEADLSRAKELLNWQATINILDWLKIFGEIL